MSATSVLMLLASAHASPSERPFVRTQSAPHAFARYVVQAFKPVSHIHFTLFATTHSSNGNSAHDESLMTLHDDVMLPTIHEVVFDKDGGAHLRGRGAPGVIIALQSDGRRLAHGEVSNSGAWGITLDKHLTHGVHRVQAIAYRTGDDHHVRGEHVRLALPQSLSKQSVDQTSGMTVNTHGPSLHSDTAVDRVSSWRIAQVGDNSDGTLRQRAREQDPNGDAFGAPFFNWLRRSSEIYGDVIVPDLSGEERGLTFVHPSGRAVVDRRERIDNQGEERRRPPRERRESSWPQNGIVDQLTARWQSFSAGISDWWRQAQETYRAEIADELSTGARRPPDRVRRGEAEDRVARTETYGSPPTETTPKSAPLARDRDEAPDASQQDRAKLERWPVVEVTPSQSRSAPDPTPSPRVDWPVVTESQVKPESIPEVKPDPKNEALIRQAEEDAARARELARQAAERAEQTRRETEALLEEERRLNEEMAKRAAAEKAARDDALQKRLLEADERAAEARRQAAEKAEAQREREKEERARAETEAAERARLEAEATERARVEAEAERARQQAERRAAEALAAAATQEADEKFQSGEVSEPGDVVRAKPQQDFTVAETVPPRRSLKDSAAGTEVEEGSTLGNVDDFDPSVRYVYDMGDAARAKIKRKKRVRNSIYRKRTAKRKAYKKRRAKRRTYRVGKYKKRRARTRRGYKSRGYYRKRRSSYRRRLVRYRMSRGARRLLRSFARGYRYKARRRCGRRHVMRRKIFLSRMRWRRR